MLKKMAINALAVLMLFSFAYSPSFGYAFHDILTKEKSFELKIGKWIPDPSDVENTIEMVQVGEMNTVYTIPLGIEDDATAEVSGGYLMASTQTTYELWHAVRVWAEANGYHFQNLGREGSHGATGELPTDARLEPVTEVSGRDIIVWLNAFSQSQGLNPVYRDENDNIIKDSRDANAAVVDAAIQTPNNGFRLPTGNEWEMAARWKNDTESTNGSILAGGRYWTPGNYASGATAQFSNQSATQAVAWYSANSAGNTQAVAQLTPNHLGIYDMSGNVWEYVFSINGGTPGMRGGTWSKNFPATRVGATEGSQNNASDNESGFRFARNP